MKNLLLTLFLLPALASHSQFYYKDIVTTVEMTRLMNSYIVNKVSSVKATATDEYGAVNNSFYELHEIKENGRVLKISKLDESGKAITTYRFDNSGFLVSQEDSSNGVKSVTGYRYDAEGMIISVLNISSDAEGEFNQQEEHVWQYNGSNVPVKMWKIKNRTDSLGYEFGLDENGHVADEHLVRNKVIYDPLYYYYYDEKGRLSDIARYNKVVKKIIPDFVLTYDEKNQLIQKLATVPGASAGYATIRYGFNEKGLKTKEVIYNRLKQKTGAIDYSYTFSN